MRGAIMEHVMYVSTTYVKGAVASTSVTIAGLVSMILGDVTLDQIAVSTGGTAVLFYTGWRVFSDNRATESVRVTLEKQLETLEKDRDYWRAEALTQHGIIQEEDHG